MSKTNKSSTQTFTIGQAVTVTNPATDHQPLAGTIEKEAKGWFNVRLADGRIVSARAGSLTDATPKGPTFAEMVAPLAQQPDQPTSDEQAEDVPHERHPMAVALEQARKHYVKCRRPDGSNTAHNGDLIAKALRDLEPVEVAYLADKVLDVPEGFHVGRYGKLNPGQVRMNSGNRIRAAWKHALDEGLHDEQARISTLIFGEIEIEEQEDEIEIEEQEDGLQTA